MLSLADGLFLELCFGIPFRSSLFVNQHTGVHMRKILEAMNASGMFGPIKESSLDILSPKKRNAVCENLIRTAVKVWHREAKTFEFEMRGEVRSEERRVGKEGVRTGRSR